MSDVSFDPASLEPGQVDLSSLDEDFEAVKPASRDAVPDGNYRVRVRKVLLGYSKNRTPMLTWDLVVANGEHSRRHIFKNSVFTEESMPFIKADLQLVGLALHRLSDLSGRLHELDGLMLDVGKRTSADGEYTNVYFNRLVDAPGANREAASSESC